MKFGVREICNVTFKAAAQNQKIGAFEFAQYQPIFTIDTATASELTQESTTVYAQGGRGYNRLIAWEGEKTMTFTVTDALMSPMGLAVLSGAGLIKAGAEKPVHVHVTMDVAVADGQATVSFEELADEIGVPSSATINVCADAKTPIYATLIDATGYMYGWTQGETAIAVSSETTAAGEDLVSVVEGDTLTFENINPAYNGKVVRLDFYVVMQSGASEITIAPEDFGGYFYVEADTLFRREDNGQDMATTITFPRVKVQSGFTFSMAATGDPSTFDFTMDAFPGYTQFNKTKKVCVVFDIVGSDNDADDAAATHSLHKPAEVIEEEP